MHISISLLLTLLQLIFNLINRLKSKEISVQTSLPQVSILKPVKSVRIEQMSEIRSLFELDYPDYEILFALDENDSSSAELIKSIAREFPEKKFKIIFTPVNYDFNPKIQKLQQLLEVSSGELLWASDLNVSFKKDDLKKIVSFYLQEKPALIFFPVQGEGSITFGSLLENSYLNFFLSGTTVAAWLLFRIPIIVGKSLFIEKSKIQLFKDGFLFFKQYLAEDQMLGEIFQQQGLKISTNLLNVRNINRRTTLKAFADRIVRWNKLRFHISPQFYLFEPILNPIFLALILVPLYYQSLPLLFYAICAIKIISEFISYLLASPKDLTRKNILRFIPAILLKDMLLAVFYFFPFFSVSIIWHEKKYRIKGKSIIR